MQRSLWLEEALAADPGDPCPPLRGAHRADVCIVGGGFAGLWTALRLKELEPACDVVLLDADIVGGGASGRNGGFVLGWWAKLAGLVHRLGEDEGMRLARVAGQAVAEIAEFTETNGIDCHLVQRGWLWVASSPAQIGDWEPAVQAAERRGVDVYLQLTPDELHERIAEPTHLAGVLSRPEATVQPALLARGLRRVALERGVRIHERTRMTDLDRRRPPTVRTLEGAITADAVVLTLGAWSAAIPELRRAIVPLASDVVATAPAPELLEQINWTGGEAISDARLLVHYYRTTRDRRVVFGKAGGGLAFHGRIGPSFDHSEARAALTARHLHALLPALAKAPITHAWSGPVDRSATGSPLFGRLGESISYAAGFSGNGVGPSLLAGRVMASLSLRRNDEWSRSGLVSNRHPLFPPEPARYVGGRIVREAVRRKERAEDAGAAPSRVAAALARLAPAGFAQAEEE
jgi:glycine/D-amino acid oxidase-like deaminating enzyme